AVAIHHGPDVVVLDDARVLGVVLRGLDHAARRAADVEGPHGQLRAGLADRLGGDDAYRLPELGQAPRAQVASVAHDADTALRLGGDDVRGRVDEAAGQIPGVRGLERGVGQALAGAVGRGEVLEHRESFAEVRGDRRLDDLARGLGHEAAHARELPDLLLRA